MKAFLDTSSLIKLYHQEEGSGLLIQTLSNDVDEIFLSELAVLEFRSALWKKVREKEIEENTAIEVIKCFSDDGESFQWIPLQSVTAAASDLLMKYGRGGLRTLDSLQLATALTLKNDDCIFLTSDKLLGTFLREENLKAIF